MKLGIMQPYFFPYLGYFDLVHCTDQWIVFDTAQYMRHAWVNRNRILHPTAGWQYIIAPLRKHALKTAIKDVQTNDDFAWRAKIPRQLEHYRKRAPFFKKTLALVEACLAEKEGSISRLNTLMMAKVCAYLGITFTYKYLSEMNLTIPAVEGPGEWALRISESVRASEYVNPSRGRDIFDPETFNRAGIRLTIRDIRPMVYACKGYAFEPNLSVIDVLMWNEPEKVRKYLDSCANNI